MRNYPPAIVDRKIRFALVGCGRIAKNHFGAIAEHRDRCELVGVCDIAVLISLSVMKPSSRMAPSTTWARSSAAFGSRAGDRRDGAFKRPASSAASPRFTSLADLLK